MSRDCKINRNRPLTTLPNKRSFGRVVLACMLLVVLSAATVFAKGGDPLTNFPVVDGRAAWQKATAMAVDSAGDIIAVGEMDNGSNKDYQLVKFKADGTGLAAWAPVSYGHGSADNDIATAVAVDGADNIIVTGTVWNGSNNDIHTIKYNGTTGAVIWQHTYDSGGADTATSITVDGSGNIYVAGSAFNGTKRDDYLIIKYPSAGAVPSWVELYDDTDAPNSNPNYDNRIMSISAGTDGIAVTGYTHTGGLHFDILTRKYGFDKSLIRSWRYSSAGNLEDRGVAVKMDSSGNVIVTAFVSNASNRDMFTVKYNPGSDTPQWTQTYAGNGIDEPKVLWVDSAGDVYVAGYTTTLAGNEDFITIRYSSAGSELWKSILNAGGGSTDIATGIAVDNAADGGVFVSGYSTLSGNDDFLIIKYKKDTGNLLWEKNWNGAGNNNDRPVGIALDPLTLAVCVAGWTYSADNNYDFAALKYDFGPLNAPSDLTATAASNTSITLTWLDNASNEDRYYIQRKLGEGGTFADITTIPATLPANTITYTDSGLTANNYYYYRVRAYNAANGDSHYSNEARALTKVVSYDSPVWKYLYASPNGKEDKATAITVGSDDHPVVTGKSDLEEGTSGLYSFDYLTVKIDRANDQTLKWKARYDSGDGGTDMASGVALDSSGNVLVTGNSWLSSGGDSSDELYTRKVATAGLNDPLATPDFMWEDQYGTQAGIDLATAIAMAEDGSNNSVVIGYGAGSGSDDTFIIKYADNGSRSWTPIVYDSGRHDHPTALALDAAGNIFVTGYSFDLDSSPDSYDWFVAKYNGATGVLVWSETYDVSNVKFGGVSRADLALSIDTDSAGNAYVTGYATNNAGNTVMYTVKYDGAATPAGNRRIWEKSFNYSGYDAEGVTVKVDPIDGAVVVAGDSYVSATDSDLHLIRYNPADGGLLWDRNFDLPGKYDYASAMTMDSSGYIYLAGNSRSYPDTDTTEAAQDTSDVLSLIYDHEGTFLGAMTYNGAAGKQDEASAITVNYQGEAFVAGFTKNAAGGDYDYLVFKQKNNYILVPAPLGLSPQADYSKVDLTWRENTPSTSFRIERTLGPSNPLSVWGLVTTKSSGTLAHTDTGLAPGINYCYRVDAYSGSLNSRKIEKCVTTTLAAAVLSPLTVDSATQITLNWSQVTGNTGYKIQRKITAGGTWADLTTKVAGQNSHVDSGLTPGTVYYYRVYTNSPSGYSLTSNEQNAVTKPAAPTMAANGTITTTSVVVNWSNVAGETGYKIERKAGAGGTWAEIITRGTDVLTYTDNTPALTFNTQYYYRVRAYNASGDSDYSAEQGAMTKFTTPTLSSATGSATTKIDLVWTDVAGETGYTIQYAPCNQNTAANAGTYCSNTAYYGGWNTLTTVAADVTTYQHTGLTSGYAYRYQVIANTTGNSSDPSSAIIAWTWMTGTTVTIAPASETSLTVSWTDIVGETNYTLERKQGAGGTWAEVTGAIGMAVNTVSKADTGLSLSTEYCYRVKAFSTNPNGPPSVYSTNEPCLFTPLAAPVQNAPTGVTTSQVDLSWSNVSGNTGYEVQRCQFTQPDSPLNAATYLDNDSYWNTCSTIATLAADTVSYTSTGLTSGFTYRYKVRDSYSGGYSAWSNAKAVTTIAPAPTLNVPTAASTTQLNLAWGNVNGNTSYSLEWKLRSGADCTAGSWSLLTSPAATTYAYNHTSLTAGTFYCYRIKAVGPSGDSAWSTERSQTTLAVPPTLNAPSGVTASQAVLTWNTITGNTGYKIERKIGVAGAWGTLVANTAADAVTYTNTGLTAGTLYYYRISTNNAGGASAASNEVSTTTTPVAPTVTATTVSDDRIDLSWAVKLGATNYKIERKEGAGAYSQIDNVAVTYVQKYCGYDYPTVACPTLSDVTASFQDSGLTENTSYCYQLKSWNSTGGDSGYSTEKCATTSAMAVQNLSVAAVNSAKIRLDWTPVACIPIACDNPDGFEIERQIRSGIWVKLATVDGSTLTYADTLAIDPNKQYSYRIKTFKGSDKSPYSNTATATTPLYATSPPSCP